MIVVVMGFSLAGAGCDYGRQAELTVPDRLDRVLVLLGPTAELPLEELRVLAEEGKGPEATLLGVMYRNGRGVAQDLAEAVRWYSFAADLGFAQAQHSLGFMYDNGEGIPQDYSEAVRLYRLAAEQGYSFAQHNLGLMVGSGLGARLDIVEGHMWLNLAASQSSGTVRKTFVAARDGLAERMSPGQIAEAQRRAREWTPTPEP